MCRIHVVKWWALFCLVCCSRLAVGISDADENAASATSQDLGAAEQTRDPKLAEQNLKLAQQARLVWGTLDVIEQHHIRSATRTELMSIVAGVMNGLGRKPQTNDAVAEMLRCQNAAEFAEMLRQNWQSREIPVDVIASTVMKTFEEKLGPLRLIRNQDAAVEEQFSGNRYVGLGVALSVDHESGIMRFPRIVPGGPADRAGFKDNTEILEIDGRSLEGLGMETVLDLLRGPSGTDVTLKIRDPEAMAPRRVTVTRGVVRFDSVLNESGEPLSRGAIRLNQTEPIGCLKIQDISGSTLHELRTAEELARRQEIRVLILDLRSSGRSSDFHQALLVADGLLDGGPIWKHGRRTTEALTDVADRDCLFRDMRLVVLINQFTGAAHAAIAAALQDAGRASVVGSSPSFKGDFSETIPIEGEPFSISLETLRLTRANGAKTWPVVPDHSAGQPPQMNDVRLIQGRPPLTIMKKSSGATSITPQKQVVRVQEITNPPASAQIPANKVVDLPGRPKQRFVQQPVEQPEVWSPQVQLSQENEAALVIAGKLLRESASQAQ